MGHRIFCTHCAPDEGVDDTAPPEPTKNRIAFSEWAQASACAFESVCPEPHRSGYQIAIQQRRIRRRWDQIIAQVALRVRADQLKLSMKDWTLA